MLDVIEDPNSSTISSGFSSSSSGTSNTEYTTSLSYYKITSSKETTIEFLILPIFAIIPMILPLLPQRKKNKKHSNERMRPIQFCTTDR